LRIISRVDNIHTSGKRNTNTETKTMTKTRQDSKGRTWSYNDADGSWTSGENTIGCGRRNGSKWQIWDGPAKGYYEYQTLKAAMEAC
jgi:hypothetical protein